MRGKGPTRDSLQSLSGGLLSPCHACPSCDSRTRGRTPCSPCGYGSPQQKSWFSFLPVGGTRVASPWSHTPPPSWVSFRVQRQSTPGKAGSIHPSPYTPILSPVLSRDEPSASLSHSQLLNSHHGLFSSPRSMGRNVGTITMKGETRHLILERGRLAPVAGEGGCF